MLAIIALIAGSMAVTHVQHITTLRHKKSHKKYKNLTKTEMEILEMIQLYL